MPARISLLIAALLLTATACTTREATAGPPTPGPPPTPTSGASAPTGVAAPTAHTEAFYDTFRQAFIEECAIGGKVLLSDAQAFCGCVYDKLDADGWRDSLIALAMNSAERPDTEVPRDLQAAVDNASVACWDLATPKP